ncbi:MAG: TatD family hydrolase [Desulfobacterales bacterium]|nr:TatD family hydrolase [Desulfobacterales bacterium]MBS3754291.1 TatD family hydrolase [Desulfobacterales bacterium]
MNIFDSHCHLNDKAYHKDLEQVIENAGNADVNAMMIVGITEKTSRQAVEIAEAYEGCYASVGIHPHDAKRGSEKALAALKEMADSPMVRAWGETGLDFNRMHSPADVQEKWFVRQTAAAAELDLPLIFHERDSEGRLLDLLRAHAPKNCRGVVHCFSGTPGEMEQYLDMGLYIGITGILTISKRGRQLRDMAVRIPEDRLLVETDAPYLTPAPEKNTTRRNEPAFVKSVLFKLAEIRNTDPAHLARVTWENTCRLFAIDAPQAPEKHQ